LSTPEHLVQTGEFFLELSMGKEWQPDCFLNWNWLDGVNWT
jgi:hypothetical protein